MPRVAAASVIAIVVLTSSSSAAKRYGLTLGKFKVTGYFAKQAVVVTNNTASTSDTVDIECGFFAGSRLVGTGHAYPEKIPSGGRAFVEALASDAGEADRAECRVVD